MKIDEFIKEVQTRGQFGSKDQAFQATQATLSVLGQRLFGGEAEDLAAQLPEELGSALLRTSASEPFGIDEFYERISQEEGIDFPDAVQHARAVVSVLCDAVTSGEIDDVRSQLPKEFNTLFEEAGKASSSH